MSENDSFDSRWGAGRLQVIDDVPDVGLTIHPVANGWVVVQTGASMLDQRAHVACSAKQLLQIIKTYAEMPRAVKIEGDLQP